LGGQAKECDRDLLPNDEGWTGSPTEARD
jgi:hypothetical protein